MTEPPAYDPQTGKNTIDMRRFLHGGEPRLSPGLIAGLGRVHEIIEREFCRNRQVVLDRYLARGWVPEPWWLDGVCYPRHAPIRSGQTFRDPAGRLVTLHIDELVHNSGEVTAREKIHRDTLRHAIQEPAAQAQPQEEIMNAVPAWAHEDR